MTHDLWENLNTTVVTYLAGVTLSDLVHKQRTQAISGPARLQTMLLKRTTKNHSRMETPVTAI